MSSNESLLRRGSRSSTEYHKGGHHAYRRRWVGRLAPIAERCVEVGGVMQPIGCLLVAPLIIDTPLYTYDPFFTFFKGVKFPTLQYQEASYPLVYCLVSLTVVLGSLLQVAPTWWTVKTFSSRMRKRGYFLALMMQTVFVGPLIIALGAVTECHFDPDTGGYYIRSRSIPCFQGRHLIAMLFGGAALFLFTLASVMFMAARHREQRRKQRVPWLLLERSSCFYEQYHFVLAVTLAILCNNLDLIPSIALVITLFWLAMLSLGVTLKWEPFYDQRSSSLVAGGYTAAIYVNLLVCLSWVFPGSLALYHALVGIPVMFSMGMFFYKQKRRLAFSQLLDDIDAKGRTAQALGMSLSHMAISMESNDGDGSSVPFSSVTERTWSQRLTGRPIRQEATCPGFASQSAAVDGLSPNSAPPNVLCRVPCHLERALRGAPDRLRVQLLPRLHLQLLNVTELLLPHNALTDLDLAILLPAVQAHAKLQLLDLSYNRLALNWKKGEHNDFLCTFFQWSRLERLSLQGNALGDEGMLQVTTALRSSRNKWLTHLEVGHCKLGTQSGKYLRDLLTCSRRYACPIQVLNLTQNALRAEGITELSQALAHNETLREVDVSWNRLGTLGAQALMDVLVKNGGHTTLVQLNLGSNGISPDTRKRIAALLVKNAASTAVSHSMADDLIINFGGIEGLTEVVHVFQGFVAADPKFAIRFPVSTLARMHHFFVEYVADLLIGEKRYYHGISMSAAHGHLRVTDDEFDAIYNHFIKAIQTQCPNLPPVVLAMVLVRMESIRSAVVSSGNTPPSAPPPKSHSTLVPFVSPVGTPPT